MRTLKYALRALARTPVLTAVAVFSLALGFGANAAISSLFRQVLLRPLPVPQADRLINLGGPGDREGHVSCSNAGACDAVFSYPMFRDLAQAPAARTGVSGIAAHRGFDANLAARGQTLSGRGELVSGSYFPVLGLTPSLGRLLDPTDDRPGGPPVAVLTNAYWRTQLGADSAVVGRTILVNGHPTIVVGVAPRGFTGTTFDDHPQLFVPITLRPLLTNANDTLTNRRDYWVYLFARLAPGVTAEQARRGLNAVYRPILRDVEAPLQGGITPAALARFRDRVLTVEPGARGQTRLHADARTPLGLLLLTSGVVLLIACANVANLLLVRGAARAGEMALRLALGATRQRLLALLLTESLVLAVAGAVVGLVVARWTLGGLARLLPSDVGGTVHVALDPWMFATTAALALSTGVVFGLFPAVQATRVDLARPIRGGAGQVAGSSRGAARFRLSLVAGQIALSMTLLVSAGLFVRSLVNITRERLGVNVERVVTFALAPGRNAYSGQRSRMLFQQVEQALAAVPGVTGVTGARRAPPRYRGGSQRQRLRLPRRPRD